MQPHHAERGVGLVHGAVGRDAQIVFRAALAAAERRGAVIAGPGIDTVEYDHWRGPLSCRYFPIPQTTTMGMTMAMNCSSTPNRIRFCQRLRAPPPPKFTRAGNHNKTTA